MKLYNCSNCHNPLYFENSICLNCQHAVGFDATKLEMITLESKEAGIFSNIAMKQEKFSYCQNFVHATCNWLVGASPSPSFCLACELNRTIPLLTVDENLRKWRRIESAKHRLIYTLLRLDLPVKGKSDEKKEEAEGLTFDFLADVSAEKRVMTGHDNGIITLNIEEADEAERVRNKRDLGEKYRTLLGHFRHEVGHYYWDVLIKDSKWLQEYRQIYGDETKDYGQALETYYKNGAPADWANNFISVYATSHPWEDWAETWAHYLHLMDTLETAYAFGIGVDPHVADEEQEMQTHIGRDPFRIADFDRIMKMWLPLTFAVNSLNRSMGHQDFYPFVISPSVVEKLKFIHKVCRDTPIQSQAQSQAQSK